MCVCTFARATSVADGGWMDAAHAVTVHATSVHVRNAGGC